MISEFKKFAMKGNLVDLAVGFIMGGAFATVVKSFVNDIIMPPIGLLMGGQDFSEIKLVLQQATEDTAEVAIGFGAFMNAAVAFLIVAFVMFMLIKAMNNLKEKEEKAPTAPPKQEILLEEIRDLLSKNN